MGKKIISNKIAFIVSSILIFFLSLVFLCLAYFGIIEQNIDLDKCSQTTSLVDHRGMDFRIDSKNRKTEVFYIKLADLQEKIGVYRMSGNYEDLLSNIKAGDTLKVWYFDNSDETENVNIDLVQVEKDKEIILEKNEYERKQSSLIFIGIGGFIGFMLILYFNRKHYIKVKALEVSAQRKKKNNN